MKTLVTFYSRTGRTKELAKEISKQLNAELDEIIDNKKRCGIFGWLGAGKDAMEKNLTEIKHDISPKNYGLVVIGTPVWASSITPAIRTYLKKHKFKKVAFFIVSGSGDTENAAYEMEKLSKKPIAVLNMFKEDFHNNHKKTINVWEIKKVKEFCDKIKNEK